MQWDLNADEQKRTTTISQRLKLKQRLNLINNHMHHSAIQLFTPLHLHSLTHSLLSIYVSIIIIIFLHYFLISNSRKKRKLFFQFHKKQKEKNKKWKIVIILINKEFHITMPAKN